MFQSKGLCYTKKITKNATPNFTDEIICSWFRLTAQLYSSYILVHLISDMILLAGLVFQLDLVSWKKIILKKKLQEKSELIHSIKAIFIIFAKIRWKKLNWKCFIKFQQFRQLDFNICVVIQSALVTGPSLFIYCFFGKVATESCEKISQCLYESNWINLPVELQKYLLLMISNTQQPLYYDGFGIVVLNLQTFTSVNSNVTSINDRFSV